MRRLLIDYARQRNAAKREGSQRKVELTEYLALSEEGLDDLIHIDDALQRLEAFDPRKCRVVVLRFFGGMTDIEIAEALGIGERTVKRDWNVAKAWLHGELRNSAT